LGAWPGEERAMSEREIFMAAFQEADPAARGALLDRECGPDGGLRNRVEALLRKADAAGSFLEHPALGDADTATENTGLDRSADTTVDPGTAIGPYMLVEVIGEGGMGTVYLAEQSEPVKRRVALKLIKPGMDSQCVLARFEAERQALALMDHPNIAKVFDGGAAASGRPFFVMELVQGAPITQFCDEKRLSVRQRLELFLPVCRAIQHAHQKGVIHRDLKPSNILVATYDGVPTPKVIDFGVAKATDQRLTDKTLTAIGTVVGTPEYMSPEQAEPGQVDVDTRSDVYSLGVVLYELLTGTTPLDRGRVRRAALWEVLRLIREEEPPTPSCRIATTAELPTIAANRGLEPRKLSGLVRGELDWLVMKCIEKDRARRYETANILALDLQRYLHDEAVLACPPSARYRFGKFARRNKRALTIAGVVALILPVTAIFLAISNLQIRDALMQRTQALTEKAEAYEKLDSAKRDIETANTDLDLALLRERESLYLHRVALAHREWQAGNAGRALQLLAACPPEYRNWEWHYLSRLCRTEELVFDQHTHPVTAMAYSPDGRYIASGGGNSPQQPAELRVWEASTGKELFSRLVPAGGLIQSVSFSPDGLQIATAGFDAAIRIWNAATGDEVRVLGPRRGPAVAVCFSPAGGRVASVGADSTLRVWDAATGRTLVNRIIGSLQGLSYASDGNAIALACGDGTVRVVDAMTGNDIRRFRGHEGKVIRVAFSPDGRRIASVGADDTVRIWDATSGEERLAYRTDVVMFSAVAFSPDSRRIASAGQSGLIKVWEAETGKDLITVRGHARRVEAVEFSPDGRHLASASVDRTVKIWDSTREQESIAIQSQSDSPCQIAFRPDRSRSLLITGQDAVIQELPTEERLVLFRGPEKPSGVVYSPNGRLLAVAYTRNPVEIRDAHDGRLLCTLETARGVTCMAFDSGIRQLSVAHKDGAVRIWNAQTGREIAQGGGGQYIYRAIAYDADGRTVYAVGWEGTFNSIGPGVLRQWDASTGKEVRRVSLETRPLSAAFSLDRRCLATGGVDGSVRIWDVATGQQRLATSGHGGSVHCLAFSPDGRRIASAGTDLAIMVWDTGSGLEVVSLRGHRSSVGLVSFSPDGHFLVSTNHDGSIRLWDGRPFSTSERDLARPQ
jgi:WD40 repeat protein/serine/threonine protein kinase